MTTQEWEGIAREIHESTGGLMPVDAFELADACGVATRPWAKSRGEWSSAGIRYPGKARPTRQHGVVAHELGHWALWDAGEDHHDEHAARYLAGALMLPRAAFTRDLARCDWDLHALRDRHPNVSAEMIVVRITQVARATAWVWDDGVVRRRYGIKQGERIDDIVDRVISRGAPVRDGRFRGWPLLERAHRRVIVVRAA